MNPRTPHRSFSEHGDGTTIAIVIVLLLLVAFGALFFFMGTKRSAMITAHHSATAAASASGYSASSSTRGTNTNNMIKEKWIAHRGLSALHPENTFAAYDAAREAGCHGIEVDVQLSANGTPVLKHDPLDGTETNLPTLKDFLEKYNDLELLVELKGTFPKDAALLDAVLPLLEPHLDQVYLLCFDYELLRVASRRNPQLRCVLNFDKPLEADLDTSFLHALSPNVKLLGPNFNDRGLTIATWTCNTKANIQKARAAGATLILSDHPPTLGE